MDRSTDREILRHQQYRQPDNLNARIRLHQLYSQNSYGWYRAVMDHLELTAGLRTLEVGCGKGDLWLDDPSRIPADARVTLTDFSTGMLQSAAGALCTDPRFSFSIADVQALPFPGAQFERVVANHMLYHVPDRPAALQEIRRVLTPGGRLLAATNGAGHLKEIHALVRQVQSEPESPVTSAAFTLENGPGQLEQVFPKVERFIYEDHLWVTETEPLIAYILSMKWGQSQIGPEQVQRLTELITDEIARQGGFYIQKSSGILLAAAA